LALPAARAAECASASGRFSEMLDALYSGQDSLGLKTWSSYARDAGIEDTIGFSRCNSNPETPQLVSAGTALARRLGVNGTPTLILNGWRYGYTPPDTELFRAIDDILASRSPYPGVPAKESSR
jgi:protein-disulfide isomerase